MDLSERIAELQCIREGTWASLNYLEVVREIIADINAAKVIEIGGGRAPSFTRDEIEEMGICYTSNDISQRELSLAPDWVSRAQFDVQSRNPSDIVPFLERYDLAFSKMVMEHVGDYQQAYLNLYSILRPGGIAIAFHPVLFSLPFVINRLIPEAVSERLLQAFFPNRTDNGTPKFPALYSGCRISNSVRDRIRAIGFSGVWQVPFYWHNYYAKIPIIRSMHEVFTEIVKNMGLTFFASFAFTIVRK